MTNQPSSNSPDDTLPGTTDPMLQDLVSEWQFARIRLGKLKSNPELRLELILVLAVLGLVFIAPAITWMRVWTLSPEIQSYGLMVIPAVICWIWIARRRLAAPEIDFIRKTIRVERQTRFSPKELGEREKTVLDVLINDAPVPDVRSRTLLYFALVVDTLAFWLRNPSLTCLGFILTCAGLILYRHGKYAFRAALFPFLLLFTMIPIPGLVRDTIVDRAQPAILGMVEHTVNNVKTIAILPIEGDPLNITMNVGTAPYPIYAERAGLCIPESIVVILCMLFYLSLIRTSNPLPKIGVVASTVAACFVVILARLVLIAWVAAYDKDSAAFLEVLTRFLLVGIDFGFVFLFVRGFKCVKFHRWVSLSLKF
jgi:hypothetical protein